MSAPTPAHRLSVVAPHDTAPAAPVVAAPARKRVSFSADSLFTYDHWEVQTRGKRQHLTPSRENSRVRNTRSSQSKGILIGSALTAYNQKLSIERSVLWIRQGLPRDFSGVSMRQKISAVGKVNRCLPPNLMIARAEQAQRQADCMFATRTAAWKWKLPAHDEIQISRDRTSLEKITSSTAITQQ